MRLPRRPTTAPRISAKRQTVDRDVVDCSLAGTGCLSLDYIYCCLHFDNQRVVHSSILMRHYKWDAVYVSKPMS
jgi:hypothetical protein